MSRFQLYIIGTVWLVIVAFGLAGCGRSGPTASQEPPEASKPPSTPPAETLPTATLVEPSATPLMPAIRVNGLEVSLPEFQAELAQLQALSGAEPSEADRQRAVNNIVENVLLAEAAYKDGFQISEEELEIRIAALAESLGGAPGLDAWMQANGYDPASFRRSLERSIAAAWQRDQIITTVPRSAEQIHARQILLYNADEAREVYTQLQAGSSFDNLAIKYDPVTRGDLGWFPRGYLLDPTLDEAVFTLEPGAYTAVIQTAAGFHILQILERAADRALSPEALLIAQSRAVQEWLQQRRSESQIEVLLP